MILERSTMRRTHVHPVQQASAGILPMVNNIIAEVIRIASNVSLLLPLMMYLRRMRFASREVHIIGALVIFSGLSDVIGLVLFSRNQSTVVLFNTYYALMFFLLTWFYYQVLFVTTHKFILWISIAVYIQSFVLVTAFLQSFFQYQTVMWLVTAVVMIIYSIAYFFHSLSAIGTTGNAGSSLIWINIGVMIYFCLNLFLFVMGDYVLTKLDPETSAMIWSSHNVNNIIKNILFAIGIYFSQKRVAV